MNNHETDIVIEKAENVIGNTENVINWKQKLSSRKLWAALLAAVFALLTALFGEELPAEMVTVLRTGIYGLIAYIFGEGAVDVARVIAGNKQTSQVSDSAAISDTSDK